MEVSGRVGCRPPAFAADGRSLYVVAGHDVRCLSSANGTALHVLRGHTDAVTAVCPHATNWKQVVTASLDGTLRFWDTDDGACVKTVSFGRPITHAVVPIAAGGTPAAAAVAYLALLDPAPATTPAAVDYPVGEEVACCRVRPVPSSYAATVADDGTRRPPPTVTVVEVTLATGAITHVLAREAGFVTSLIARWCSGGGGGGGCNVAAAFTVGRGVYVWRRTPAGIALVKGVHREELTTAAMHPNDDFVTTGDVHGNLITWLLPSVLGEAPSVTLPPPHAHLDGATSTPLSPTIIDGVVGGSGWVRWHAHAVWTAAYTPDGACLYSGGEEAVLVQWVLPTSTKAAGGGVGPVKDASLMTYLPRVGAPIRHVTTFAARHVPAGGGALPSATSAGGAGSQVVDLPAGAVVMTLIDNTVVMINTVTLTEMWRVKGLAIAGVPALPTIGVVRAITAAAVRDIHRRAADTTNALPKPAVKAALAHLRGQARGHHPSGTSTDTTAQVRHAAVAALFAALGKALPPASLGAQASAFKATLLAATTRYLARGVVVDPRSRHLVVNGLPGRGSLQWYDLTRRAEMLELEVVPSNHPSRKDATPPAPVRVTHASFSADGMCLVTVDVAQTLGQEEDAVSLKFWQWSPASHGYVLNTRVDSPHKTRVTALEFHPGSRLVVTGSADRTFKLWEETTAAPLVSIAYDQHNQRAASGKRGDTGAPPPVEPRLHWACKSVGFFRDLPVTAAAFSGDGSCLALGYGHLVTLWDWRDNTLRKVLHHAAAVEGATGSSDLAAMATHTVKPDAGAVHTGEGDGVAVPPVPLHFTAIQHLAFCGLSPLLAAVTRRSVSVWDVRSCTLQWSYAAHCVAFAPDRIGLEVSPRFALVVAHTGHATDLPHPPADAAPTATGRKGKKGAAPTATALAAAVPAPAPSSPGSVVTPSYTLCVWEAESPVPLLAQRLPDHPLTPHLHLSALPSYIQASPYALSFAPGGGAGGGKGGSHRGQHDVIVVGPTNDMLRVATTGTATTATATATTANTAPAPLAHAAPPQPSGVGFTGTVAAYASPVTALSAAALTAPGPTPAVVAPLAPPPATSTTAWAKATSTLGPTTLISHDDAWFTTLINTMLPQAPTTAATVAGASSGKGGEGAGGGEDTTLAGASAAGSGMRAVSSSPTGAEPFDMASELRAWGMSGWDGVAALSPIPPSMPHATAALTAFPSATVRAALAAVHAPTTASVPTVTGDKASGAALSWDALFAPPPAFPFPPAPAPAKKRGAGASQDSAGVAATRASRRVDAGAGEGGGEGATMTGTKRRAPAAATKAVAHDDDHAPASQASSMDAASPRRATRRTAAAHGEGAAGGGKGVAATPPSASKRPRRGGSAAPA